MGPLLSKSSLCEQDPTGAPSLDHATWTGVCGPVRTLQQVWESKPAGSKIMQVGKEGFRDEAARIRWGLGQLQKFREVFLFVTCQRWLFISVFAQPCLVHVLWDTRISSDTKRGLESPLGTTRTTALCCQPSLPQCHPFSDYLSISPFSKWGCWSWKSHLVSFRSGQACQVWILKNWKVLISGFTEHVQGGFQGCMDE